MDRRTMKYKLLILFIALTQSSFNVAKVIQTNTKIPLQVKNTDTLANLTNPDLLNASNLLTKLGSNEIDPNVHPMESSSPQLAEDSESVLTNEVVPEVPAIVDGNPEVSPDVNPDNGETDPVNVDDPNPINKFCKCTQLSCDCCRMFVLPILPVRAPTCARLRYLGDDKMSIQLKYGDVVLVTRTVSGRRTTPICIPMPGGFTQFCGRVYGLAKGANDFKACLGFELRADDEIEASLRVSCFRFGAKGFSVSEAEPIPPEAEKDEDDDDDDFFGLAGDDDEDDEEDDGDSGDDDDGVDLFGGDDDDDDADYPTEQDEPDYEGFSLLDDIFSGGESKKLKKSTSQSKSAKLAKAANSTVEAKNSTQFAEMAVSKEEPFDGTKMPEDGDNKVKKKVDEKKDEDEDDDEEDDDEDDEEDEDEDDDDEEDEEEGGDKNEANNKIKKEKFSTMDYFLDFVTKLMKLF